MLNSLLRHAHPVAPSEVDRARQLIRDMWCHDGPGGGPCESPICPKRHYSLSEIERRLGIRRRGAHI